MVLLWLKRFLCRSGCAAGVLGLLLSAPAIGHAATSIIIGQSSAAAGDLSQFKTPQTLPTIRIDALRDLATGRMSFLGITCATNERGELAINAVAPGSPADHADVRNGDVILAFGGRPVSSPDALRALIQSIAPGQPVKLSVRRDGQSLDMMPRLMPLGGVGRPIERVRLGVQVGRPLANGLPITEVDAGSTGALGGLKSGDVILRINDQPIGDGRQFAETLEFLPSGTNWVGLSRSGESLSLPVMLAPPGGPDRPAANFAYRPGFGPRGYNARARRDTLKIAIVGLEFPDVKHNAQISARDWEDAFFSSKTYVGRSPTGQLVHGSINDFYQELSSGMMRVQGRMLDWLPMSKKRAEYSGPPSDPAAGGGFQRFNNDGPLLNEALAKLVEREGRTVLSDYDGIFFIYAGDIATRSDTDVFWPHTLSSTFNGSRVRYSISFEGGNHMTDISILCHELGHILGLPDLYVRPPQNLASARGTPGTTGGTASRNGRAPRATNPYAETLANWDLMANQVGNGRPEHMSAWSKEQLGFITPVVIDPRVPQQIALSPIENSTNQCLKIPLRPDGSEYLLLENRRHIGFDASVPAEGLLIWRVVYGRPVLEEAHGYTGANAASISPSRIPYPIAGNNAFTPFTKPSSAAYTGDELPVYITNIQRLADGRITFALAPGYM